MCIRDRYGFHGTSHQYVSRRAADILGKPYESLKLIICHLGNGASVSAIKDGRCIEDVYKRQTYVDAYNKRENFVVR